jgi:hypothetical protein
LILWYQLRACQKAIQGHLWHDIGNQNLF